MRALVSKCGTAHGSVAYLRSTGQSAEHEVPDSRFRRGINEVYTLVVFSQKGFPKISDAENAVQSLSTDLRLAGSSKSALTTSAPSCFERFRRFRIRTSREGSAPQACPSFQEMTSHSAALQAGCPRDQDSVRHS